MFIIECVITEKCNLGCSYCYMNNNPVDMSIDTFNNILNNLDIVLKKYQQNNYHLDFFGGEPLLNWELIENAVPLLKKDKKCKSFGIISNLLELDEKKVEYIKRNNINVSFSFDGLWNEYNRPLKNGSSSLKVYKKKKDLIKQISPYGCKTMVSPTSLGTLVDNVKYLVEEWGFVFPDYSLVRDDIWNEEDIKKFKNEIRDLSNLQIEYIKKSKDVIIGFYRLYLLDMFFGKKYGKRSFGCFAGYNGMGIMPNGIGYPCARFGTNKEYPLFDFNNSYFYEDNIKIFRNQKNVNPQSFEKCQNCYLYNYCNAGCTYSQMKNDFKPVNSVCKLFKILYDECLYIFDKIGTNERFIKLLIPENFKGE